MKYKSILFMIFAVVSGCATDDVKKRGAEELAEVPEAIIPSKPCGTLYTSIMGMFAEFQNNEEKYPELFAASTQKNIVLTEESNVFITFISEGAGFENSLGYYTYDAATKPQRSSDLELHVLFPHVSDAVLNKGDRIQLGIGKFPKGTVVGFFLVIHGWQNGFVDLDKPIHFTNFEFNEKQHQQHILFKEGTCGDIVMAFEDKSLEQGSDYDFNDVIFTISDNDQQLEIVSFDSINMIQFKPQELPPS